MWNISSTNCKLSVTTTMASGYEKSVAIKSHVNEKDNLVSWKTEEMVVITYNLYIKVEANRREKKKWWKSQANAMIFTHLEKSHYFIESYALLFCNDYFWF